MNAGNGPEDSARLRARALRALSLREHSRAELERKLARYAESAAQLGQVLDALEASGLLSNQRFVQSVVQRRASRFGARRIEQELAGHHLDPSTVADTLRQLGETERDRALAVWRKRFGAAPADFAERARQQRFLAQRGFSAETISWLFRNLGELTAE